MEEIARFKQRWCTSRRFIMQRRPSLNSIQFHSARRSSSNHFAYSKLLGGAYGTVMHQYDTEIFVHEIPAISAPLTNNLMHPVDASSPRLSPRCRQEHMGGLWDGLPSGIRTTLPSPSEHMPGLRQDSSVEQTTRPHGPSRFSMTRHREISMQGSRILALLVVVLLESFPAPLMALHCVMGHGTTI